MVRFCDGSVVFGYNDRPWTYSTKIDDRFTFDALPVRRKLLDLKTETLNAARELAERYHGEQLYVYYSGGLDSEAVVWAFQQLNVPFKVVVLHDTKGVNWEELRYARRFIDQNSLDYKIESYDFEDWSRSTTALKLMDQFQCGAASVLPIFKSILENRDKVLIMGGIPEFEYDRAWYLVEYEIFYSEYKLRMHYGIEGTPHFFFWSTELFNSWVLDPIWLRYKNFGEAKKHVYQERFGLSPREKIYWNRSMIRLPQNKLFQRKFSIPLSKWIQDRVQRNQVPDHSC